MSRNKDKSMKKDTEKQEVKKSIESGENKENSIEGAAPYIDPSVKKYKKRKKTVRVTGICFAALVLFVYIGGVIYFNNHFDSGTRINQFDVSNKSVSDVEKIFEKEFQNYDLAVEYKNTTKHIKQGDGELTFTLEQSVSDIKKEQNSFLWFVNIFTDESYNVEYKANYNADKLREYLDSFECMAPENMEKPENAYVSMENGEVIVVPDETKTLLSPEKVYDVVEVAIKDFKSEINIEENDCYVTADITADSDIIKAQTEAAEEFLSIKAVYDFKGYEIPITREELAQMAYLDSNGEVQISRTGTERFVKNFADKYTTYKKDRVFKTHDGDKILINGNYYGWEIDEEKELEELYPLLLKKKDFTKKPAAKREGYAMGEMNDIGDSYVEIDFLKQTLYVYKDGKLELETPIVSGNMSRNYKTPGGLFSIDNRVYDTYLVGPTWNLHVNVWMGFNGSIGIHDAPWRAEYGGDIYTYNGSHGCVNVPYDNAMKAIEICEVGMPVVAYWLDEVEIVK
mgnify:CR=1 FL=1